MKEDYNYDHFKQWFNHGKETQLYGRYITYDQIAPLLELAPFAQVKVQGKSVNGLPIHSLHFGTGKIRVLAWSQMHGNESTTTKAVFDFINWLRFSDSAAAQEVMNRFAITIIPILNPDGALAYTRHNAKGVDLNRDAKERRQPESKILKKIYDKFDPHYCLNLHGQRTIFSVGNPPVSATVSFLSPSQDGARTITPTRKKAMQVISGVAHVLQQYIPKGIGRYDDGFNINCAGDLFQSLGTPTILFEAGHFPGDYHREKTRELMFLSLIATFEHILHPLEKWGVSDYEELPENEKNFFDIVLWNVHVPERGILDVAIQYKEVLCEKEIQFVPVVQKIRKLEGYAGHYERDLNGRRLLFKEETILEVGEEIPDIHLEDGSSITFSLNNPNIL